MKWQISEIQKQKSIRFDEILDLKSELMARNPEILDLTDVSVKGSVDYENGLYDLLADVSCVISLPSTRSLKVVELPLDFEISETYALPENTEEVNEPMILSLASNEISLDEVIADNILLEIPLQVLTDEEKESGVMPHGKNWTVLSEDDYEKIKAETKKSNSPFASLNNLSHEAE
ncbi:MAG: YceD family protein [Streptococcaceae bacterium]|jgi:uncharacterized protein|nr:YceD family protein [Streptococcaceae bacterium]